VTIYYVDSSASGANDGSSWTDAYTSLYSVYSVAAAGDTVRVAYTHTQTMTANMFVSRKDVAPVSLISTDPANDRPRAGATLTVNDTRYYGYVTYDYGFTFNLSATNRSIAHQGDKIYENCTFSVPNNSRLQLDTANVFSFTDCVFQTSSGVNNPFFSSPSVASDPAPQVIINRCDGSGLTGTKLTGSFLGSLIVDVIDSDLSPITVAISLDEPNATGTRSQYTQIRMVRCKVNASLAVTDNTITDRPGVFKSSLELIGCYSGTQSIAAWQYLRVDFMGRAEVTDAVYRDNSVAADGSKKLSVGLKAHADRTQKNTPIAARTGLGIARVWVEGGTEITIGVEIAHNAVGSGTSGRLQTNECWMAISHPSETSPAPALSDGGTVGRAGEAVAADIADSSETWTGTGTGTKQKIVSAAFTPAVSGYVAVEVFFAPESASDVTIYVCTNPVVTVI